MNKLVKKPLLLIFPFDVLAHYTRCLTLAGYLRNHFEIKFLYSEKYISFVEAEGYLTFSGAALNAEEVIENLKRFDFSWLHESQLEHLLLDHLRVFEELKPDVVLGDTIPTLKMAAQKIQVPYISLMNGYMSRYYGQARQLPTAHPLHSYLKNLPKRLVEYLVEIGEQRSFKDIHRPFEIIRGKYDLPSYQSYQDEMEGDINLLCDLPDLFPQKKLPLNYYFTAPLYYQARASTNNIIGRLDKSKKTLFISMGSTGDWQKAAFLNHPYFNAYNIVTAGDTSRVINGEHVISEVFVDIHTLHRNIDLVICHGGNGTIYQALSYGIPLLCISNHFEQEWNVYAIEKNRLGKSLDPITTVEEHFSLIEEWAARKNEVHLQLYSTKIQEAKEAFPKTINHIISTLSITPDEKFSMLNRFHRRA